MRQLRSDDVDALFAIFSDPAVMRYWSRGPFASIADAQDYLAQVDAGRDTGELYQWGIALIDDDRVIGTCTLMSVDRSGWRVEIGYALASAHWHKGYASDALPLALAYAFDKLDAHRIEADIDPRNAASLKSVERLGFRHEGHLRERYRVNGEMQDSAIFGLLRTEYPGR
ncbi:MAG: GNAT family N-acetyltransferase [Dokdonella sp.]